MGTNVILTIFPLLLCCGIVIHAHVRLLAPVSRSSMWRNPQFGHHNPPINYDDDGLYCGRVHQEEVVTTCGVCGDPYVDRTPRDNEHGGTYGKGVIAGTYNAGQMLNIGLDFTTAHWGYFEIQLCDGLPETEACFLRNRLTFPGGSTKYPVESNGGAPNIQTVVQLPSNVRCEHCILRLNYRAGNNWGDCHNGTEGMGCGLQETFRHCSDITIR